MIDIHQHLIFGMDDGAKTFEETQQMIRHAANQGITRIIATPHATPGIQEFHYQRFMEHLSLANQWCRAQAVPMEILPGCEIFYTPETTRWLQEGRIPTLAGTRHVLVEFNLTASYEELRSAARKLSNAGYEPVFAHIERYRCLSKLERIKELREDYPVLTQVNANTFLHSRGFFKNRWLRRVLEDNLIDLVASDAHNTDTRPCRLGEAKQVLTRLFDGQQTNAVFQAEQILDGLPLV